eukprot:4854316-Prymnesium_polylepis.1
MASFARSAAPRAEWTIAEATLFAARKEYELLRLLSADKKALATARRLGLRPSVKRTRTRSRIHLQLLR